MLKESLLPSVEYATPENLIIVGLIIYIVYLIPKLDLKVFDNILVKYISLFLIVYSASHSVAISVIGAIAFIMTVTNKTKEHMTHDEMIVHDFKRSGMTMDMIPDHSLDLIDDVNDVKSNSCSTNFYPQYNEEHTKELSDDISVNGFDGGANYSNI